MTEPESKNQNMKELRISDLQNVRGSLAAGTATITSAAAKVEVSNECEDGTCKRSYIGKVRPGQLQTMK